MIEIHRAEVKVKGELPVVMSEMQFGLIALNDVLKQHYKGDGLAAFIAYMSVVDKATQLIFQKDNEGDGEIKDALEYQEALDAALDNIKKS